GADVDIVDKSSIAPLHIAVWSDWNEDLVSTVRILLDKYGAEVNTKDKFGDSPLHKAARRGNEDLMKLLLDYGADPDVHNTGGKSP
ncbi:ankyrin, partial [Zopfia rhizophila CBS 207.26]